MRLGGIQRQLRAISQTGIPALSSSPVSGSTIMAESCVGLGTVAVAAVGSTVGVSKNVGAGSWRECNWSVLA